MRQPVTLNLIRHTRNFDAMRRFYVEQLGFVVIEEWNKPDNRGAVIRITDGGTVEILALGDLAQSPAPPVNTEVGIHVDDVHAWHDRLRARGVTIARGIEDAPWGHRSFGVDDPDGLRLWFVQNLRAHENP